VAPVGRNIGRSPRDGLFASGLADISSTGAHERRVDAQRTLTGGR
jgi:hypothetical protein